MFQFDKKILTVNTFVAVWIKEKVYYNIQALSYNSPALSYNSPEPIISDKKRQKFISELKKIKPNLAWNKGQGSF